MQVAISDLRLLANSLLSHLEKVGYSTVEISDDFYWDVPASDRYDRYEKPEQLSVGQLTDDWSELEKILIQKNRPLNYALVWLAAILRRIGEATNEVGPKPP